MKILLVVAPSFSNIKFQIILGIGSIILRKISFQTAPATLYRNSLSLGIFLKIQYYEILLHEYAMIFYILITRPSISNDGRFICSSNYQS